MNLVHTLFFSLNLYANFRLEWNLPALFIIELFIISLLIFNEIIAYVTLKGNYFSDFLNFFDIGSILLCMLVLGLNFRDYNLSRRENLEFYYGYWFVALKLLCLTIIYFRMLLYFRIFKTFRYLINMMLSLTKASFSTVFMIFFFLMSYVIIDFCVYNIKARR